MTLPTQHHLVAYDSRNENCLGMWGNAQRPVASLFDAGQSLAALIHYA
jgi:hypothetical protein